MGERRGPGAKSRRNTGVSGDWREFRPAIWLAIAGIAVMLLLSPPWLGAVLVGAAIGIGARIEMGRRRRGSVPRRRPPRR